MAEDELAAIRTGQKRWDEICRALARSELTRLTTRDNEIRYSFSGHGMSGNIERCQGGIIVRLWTDHAGGGQKMFIPSDLVDIIGSLLRAEAQK